ncbi:MULTISPECIES: S-formylglutathione hydrolase [Aerococcus]|uniref:S-formylglutathione hydrolase n=1 Tax=Aerococcus sanguinicola TaxID=119206 RepID=A0A5N1GQF6_9LACT|nr:MULTISPECIES: S-formylglutathione hydrolase [Aerococcus]KAA9302489.1 S-formylglutathione hydrolase [Aerococcus sanguinicola]MDK6369755.1 S-formylglutathione hydrolase [Aerococcus sp. UMB9870]MDK6680395.1 S-formylglutathione hydrolase [Aerococcus sp. UMB8608]MDK6687108.1 S-formylglutathione hydrolase [Aerococcus sp. UMB8623]MDK6940327.1 S-formylglutathione hydrolase [Aerococcus sp. UMB8487]
MELIESKKIFAGAQQRYQHQSEVLGCEMVFSLFLPKEAQDRPVPLLWFLSGLTCDDQNFSTKSGFQRYAADLGLAVLIPDTSPRGQEVADDEAYDLGQGAGFYLNASQEPWVTHYHMYDYLMEELAELVEDCLPHGSSQQAIMGHSMGGYGALMIGLKNPQRFQSISAFAPISNPSQVPWGRKAFTAYLGPDEKDWVAWDPVALVKEAEVKSPIYISQGTADEFYPEQLDEKAFLEAAEAASYPVRYQKEEGYDHSYYTISTFIGDHLNFHKANL